MISELNFQSERLRLTYIYNFDYMLSLRSARGFIVGRYNITMPLLNGMVLTNGNDFLNILVRWKDTLNDSKPTVHINC